MTTELFENVARLFHRLTAPEKLKVASRRAVLPENWICAAREVRISG
jgi:hypothetical protein